MRELLQKYILPRHRQLLYLVRGNRSKLALAMVCMLVMAGSKAATAYLIKPAVDDIFVHQNVTMLKLIPLAIMAVFLINGLAMYSQECLMSYAGQDIIRQLRNLLYNRIQDLPISFFQKEKTGALMSRITNDVNIIQAMVSTAVTGAFRDVFTIVGLTFVIFYQDWKTALIASVVLPLAFYPVVALGRRVRRVTARTQESLATLNSFLHETFAGNKIVKAFGMEEHEKRRFFDKTNHLFDFEMKTIKTKAMLSPIMEFLGGLGAASVIWYAGYKVITGASTPGTFFSFLGAVIMLYEPVKKLSKLHNRVQQGLAGADRVFEIIEREPDIKECADPVTIPTRSHRVTFEHVSFKYDQGMVLKEINLDVSPGEIIALVGKSGGGKTTLVNLLPRFFDVTLGAIRIDGIDIREASLASLRRQIAVVTQEPILFNDTVRNNIAYGNPTASPAQIENVACAAFAFDFVQKFPSKFDTLIGELGGRLSGGEKQRICIARALLKNAPILILDEATSALDTESETLVQKALENLMQGRTTFVIAHRLSTITHADRILVMMDGRIVEQGTHEHLLSCGGAYCKLYQMQFANGVPSNHALP